MTQEQIEMLKRSLSGVDLLLCNQKEKGNRPLSDFARSLRKACCTESDRHIYQRSRKGVSAFTRTNTRTTGQERAPAKI